MAIYDNLPVFKASYDLLLEVFGISQHFQRDYRYTLGEKLKNELMDLMICIYRANQSSDKVSLLNKAREDIVVIKLSLRLLHDLKQMSTKQFALLAEKEEDISKQLTLWQKSVCKKI